MNASKILKGTLDAVIEAFPRASIQRNPYFPDLLRQPDLLIMPQEARLIALYAYITDRRGHRPTYSAIEDAFEAKLVIGESTVTAFLLLDGFLSAERDTPLTSTVSFLYDAYGVFRKDRPDVVRNDFAPLLDRARPKQELMPLWRGERETVSDQLKHFFERFDPAVLNPNSMPSIDRVRVERDVAEALTDVVQGRILREHFNEISQSLASEAPRQGLARFDFLVQGLPGPVEITQIVAKREQKRIRALMAKARLARYARTRDARVVAMHPSNPILVVDGNLAGPLHDPQRFVRALVSVGWRIVHVANIRRIREFING